MIPFKPRLTSNAISKTMRYIKRINFTSYRRIISPYLLLTVLVTGLWLAALEIDHPLFFTQYDGITYSLSSYAYNWRAVIEHKTIPLINFHQRLGHTHLPLGHSSVLSPLPYLAVGLSKLFSSSPLYATEIMQIFYRGVAAIAMFILLRQLKTSPALSTIGSMLWSSYPFFVSMGAVWPIENHLMAYLPLSFLFLERLIQTSQLKYSLIFALVNLWFFFGSYPEYSFLVVSFSSLFIIFALVKKIDLGHTKQAIALLIPYFISLIILLLISTPLLLPMYEAKQASATRAASISYQEFVSYPTTWKVFIGAQLFKIYPNTLWWASSYVYQVGVFNLALLLLLSVRWIRLRSKIYHVPAYALLALIAFLLSTSLKGYLYGLPLYSTFARAHKTFPFFIFFLTLTVLGIASTVNQRATTLGKQAIHSILLLAILINILLVWDNKETSWQIKQLSSPISVTAHLIRSESGRVLTFLNNLSPDDYRFTAFNFASLYNINDFSGYDRLVARLNDELTLHIDYKGVLEGLPQESVLDYLSSWSVRYLLTSNNMVAQDYFNEHPQLKPLYQDDNILLYENTEALPYVYNSSDPKQTIPHDFGINEVNIYPTDSNAHQVIVNIAPLPRYIVYFDGKRFGRVIPAYGPIMIDVPADTKHILIRYENPLFRLGVTLFLATWLSLLLIYLLHQIIHSKKRLHRPA